MRGSHFSTRVTIGGSIHIHTGRKRVENIISKTALLSTLTMSACFLNNHDLLIHTTAVVLLLVLLALIHSLLQQLSKYQLEEQVYHL